MKKTKEARRNSQLMDARLSYHWSQQELADRIGTTPINVSRWERGVTLPGPYFRQQLRELFGKNDQELGFLPLTTEIEQEAVQSASANEKLESSSSSVSYTKPILPTSLPQQFRRRTLIFSLIIASLVLAISIAISGIAIYGKSTPTTSAQKTMQTFCQALVERDFQTAYEQFSGQLQQRVLIAEIAKSYRSCTTTPSIISDAHPQGTLYLTSGNNVRYWRLITLALDDQHIWKITSFGVSHKESDIIGHALRVTTPVLDERCY